MVMLGFAKPPTSHATTRETRATQSLHPTYEDDQIAKFRRIKTMNKASLTLLLTGIIGVASLTISVQAQTKQGVTPKFTSAKNGTFNLEGATKPFIPGDLERSVKPNEGDSRGIPKPEGDERVPMLSQKYPWSTIGRVEGIRSNTNKGYHCTGSLVGENLVLTNAHCVIDPDSGKLSQRIQFMPNVIDGEYQDVAEVEEVIYGTDFQKGGFISPHDWAIMRINKPLGRKYGYLGLQSASITTLTKNPKSLFFVGYSKDFPTPKYQKYFKNGAGLTASYENKCSITGEKDGFLLHDCATAGGSSGGPLIAAIGGEPYVVGLNNAEFGNVTNFAVKISTIEGDLRKK
jgi:protease YdgD